MAVRGGKPTGMSDSPSVLDFSGESTVAGVSGGRWWDRELVKDDDQAGAAMVSAAKNVEQAPLEQMRAEFNLLYACLYEGRELANLYQYGGQAIDPGASRSVMQTAAGQITWNVIRSVVQTVASQVSRSRPRARFVTSGGTAKQKRRAKKLTTFVDGLFTEARVYEKTQQAFIMAGAFDVAGIQVYRDNDRVAVDLVRACEIMIDANDGVDGKPRTMYRRKFVDKGVLLNTYAKGKGKETLRDAILRANAADPVGAGSTPSNASSNMVEVYEAWHLPSGEKAEDGWHVMAIEASGAGTGTLVCEEYKKKYFPIILFSWDPALSGPYGISAAAQLTPIQVAVNTLLDKIARGQHLVSRPGVWLPLSARLNKNQMSSAVGSVNYYAGNTPPTFYSPTAFTPETYQQLERHFEKAFQLYGVNSQIAAGTKEAGTTSAVAIRESLDVQTARFAVLAQRWEQLHLDIAKIAIDVARDIYKDSHKMRVSAPGTALLETIDWKDVDLEEDEYVIQVYPTSLLPTTPQGRIDRVNELVAAQIWSPKRGEAALDDLDIESAMNGERQGEKNIEAMCEEMLLEGKPHSPDPTMDLAACLRIASQYLDEGRSAKDTPERNMDLLYRFLDDTVEIQNALKAPPPAAPGAPGAPPAPGGAPPPGAPAAGPTGPAAPPAPAPPAAAAPAAA